MTHKKIDFTKLLKDYKSGWVGLSSDYKKVVVHGENLADAREKARTISDKIYFFPAGEVYSNYIG